MYRRIIRTIISVAIITGLLATGSAFAAGDVLENHENSTDSICGYDTDCHCAPQGRIILTPVIKYCSDELLPTYDDYTVIMFSGCAHLHLIVLDSGSSSVNYSNHIVNFGDGTGTTCYHTKITTIYQWGCLDCNAYYPITTSVTYHFSVPGCRYS